MDTSDLEDPDCKVYLTEAAGSFIVNSHSFYPINEGEVAQYEYTITVPTHTSTDISVIFRFPQEYSYDLVNPDRDLFCESDP